MIPDFLCFFFVCFCCFFFVCLFCFLVKLCSRAVTHNLPLMAGLFVLQVVDVSEFYTPLLTSCITDFEVLLCSDFQGVESGK